MASDEELARVRNAKAAVGQELLGRPGVVGIGIGYKKVGGRATNELAIRVYVREKKDVAPDQMIPRTIEGVATDLIGIGPVVYFTDANRYNPLVGGSSIGTCGGPPGTGTLGAIVKDNNANQFLALSCWHVLVYGTTGSFLVTQPSPGDQGACPGDGIGAVVKSAINEFVDCAVATIDPATRGVTSSIAGIGAVRGVSRTSVGDRVKKRGRTTGLTYGDVDSIENEVNVEDFAGVERTFEGQICIEGADEVSEVFCLPGDSGSVVVDNQERVIGLLFAGNVYRFWPNPRSGRYAFLNPIFPVLETLNVSMHVQPKGKEKDKEIVKEIKDGTNIEKQRDPPDFKAIGFAQTPEALASCVMNSIGPLSERLARLEASLGKLQHFISEADRPVLSHHTVAGSPRATAAPESDRAGDHEEPDSGEQQRRKRRSRE